MLRVRAAVYVVIRCVMLPAESVKVQVCAVLKCASLQGVWRGGMARHAVKLRGVMPAASRAEEVKNHIIHHYNLAVGWSVRAHVSLQVRWRRAGGSGARRQWRGAVSVQWRV